MTIHKHPNATVGYYQNRCCVANCFGVAIVRVSRDGYCRKHRDLAVVRLAKRVQRIEIQRTGVEQQIDDIDRSRRSNEQLHRAWKGR